MQEISTKMPCEAPAMHGRHGCKGTAGFISHTFVLRYSNLSESVFEAGELSLRSTLFFNPDDMLPRGSSFLEGAISTKNFSLLSLPSLLTSSLDKEFHAAQLVSSAQMISIITRRLKAFFDMVSPPFRGNSPLLKKQLFYTVSSRL